MATKLTNVAGSKLGQSVSMNSKIAHVAVPKIMADNAPVLLAGFQYKPNTNGANNETKLNTDDSPTNS